MGDLLAETLGSLLPEHEVTTPPCSQATWDWPARCCWNLARQQRSGHTKIFFFYALQFYFELDTCSTVTEFLGQVQVTEEPL